MRYPVEPPSPIPNSTIARRVFLVQENSDNIALTRRAIMQTGYVVHLEALQTADALIEILGRQDSPFSPDLILIDMNLPEDSAFELVRWLRNNVTTQHAPVVIISSMTLEKDIFKGYKCGASSVIQKPVAFTDYAHMLKDVCRYWLNISLMPRGRFVNQATPLVASAQ